MTDTKESFVKIEMDSISGQAIESPTKQSTQYASIVDYYVYGLNKGDLRGPEPSFDENDTITYGAGFLRNKIGEHKPGTEIGFPIINLLAGTITYCIRHANFVIIMDENLLDNNKIQHNFDAIFMANSVYRKMYIEHIEPAIRQSTQNGGIICEIDCSKWLGSRSLGKLKKLIQGKKFVVSDVNNTTIRISWDPNAKFKLKEAIKKGLLDDVKCLIGQVSPLIPEFCNIAAMNGHFEILEYLHNNGCPWDSWTCANAAMNGHLEIVKYLHSNGCPWDRYAYAYAAGNGHLEIITYLHNNGCPWDESACANAAANGHLEILKYLHTNNCPWDKWACDDAALNGHFEILEYLHDNGCPWDCSACVNAAANGHLEILKYLHNNSCPWDSLTCVNAAMNGHLKILKYLHTNGYPWDEKICAYAALNGHFEILKYLHDNECPWDCSACAEAAWNGNLEILEYLHDNECSWDDEACEYAVRNGHMEILDYLHTNGCPCKHTKHNFTFDFFNQLSVTDIKEDECYICKSNSIESSESIYIFPCHRSHIYHKSCYTKWVETCRKNVCVFGCSNGPK